MEKGKHFSKFSELAAALAEYQDSKYVQFWISSSRTIAGARKKGVKRPINDDLVYTEITYSCAHGGRKYRSQSTGARPNQRTFKTDCTAMIRANASKDGQHLVISVLDENHQHPLSEARYRQLPKQRRLTGDTCHKRRKVPILGASKTMRSRPQNSRSVLLSRDLRNIRNEMILEQVQGPALDTLATQVKSTGGTMEILAAEDNTLVGVFYQDGDMKRTFENYPEVLFVDAVCRANEKRMPLYVVTAENSNGEAEVVALLLCIGEDEETVGAVFQRLQLRCEHVDKTQTVVTDKDCVERKILEKIFPGAERVVCPCHVMRKFKREVSTIKMGISVEQRAVLLKILRSMCHATDEDDYGKKLEELEEAQCPKVLAYFLANWHDARAEWVQGLQRTARLGGRATNRVDSVNQRIAQAALQYESLPQLFQDLMVVTTGLRIERDQRATDVLMRTPSVPNGSDDELSFCKLLTPHAFKGVSKQLDAARVMTDVEDLTATCESCSCRFSKSLNLPCKHIFFQRKQSGLPLFFRDGVAARWTRDYYQHACQLFTDSDQVSASLESCGASTVTEEEGSLSQAQKYREASTLMLQVSATIAELPTSRYEMYIGVIKQLKDAVERGQDVCLAHVNPSGEPLLPWG